VLASGGRPIFTLDALPLFGPPKTLRLAGDLVLRAAAGAVEVIERVPMEAYLAGVVGAEMNPKWPRQALAAQAIVARSYAAARWMERQAEPWQLHWHFGVDMAYHGWKPENAGVAEAIAPTRGELLVYRGFPVLALFHASSGGRTEAF
jgi:SpoIID/LytB domain protein